MRPEQRLAGHLSHWLGRWPAGSGLDVVGSRGRVRPAWDGRIHPALGVASPTSGVLSVPPELVESVAEQYRLGVDGIAALVGRPGHGWFTAVFRWSVTPAPFPDAGEWLPARAPGVPEWLWPFGGEVLVAVDPDTGEHLAGVGIKRHDGYGHELAVVTAPAARGRGLARQLVAQAARRVLDEGAVPTYMHDPGNLASAAVAAAAGFPDLGWTAFGVTENPVR
ncbi:MULTISPECIES: GNAT family N-acetyltransferase [Streptosporangium]|uniref:GNAT superfamily N-acetyltransferase n=1 Tax=Streptosporangium brasiliense TaxID=47480 RepID=A0ABT9R0R3_9ACTN|nr:GNAT family N-acetyltransferase [Streptosporangium brasiliense]MDP9862399.1 GNAT superfamily N-acetyltransferase [Streptosporangium brasiliense]